MLQIVTLEIGLRKPGLKTPLHYLGRTSAHPLPGGRAASSSMTVRKFGIAVASSQGTVRKIS